jgi:Fur family ferric uptake transcriptional regulator
MARRGVIAQQVLDLMEADGRHCWSLDELREGLLCRGLEPDPSSIFRAVVRLEEAGWVVRVPIDDRRGRYEVAGDHHEHLVCESCGVIEPIACSVVASLVETVRASSGFAVTGHHVVLSGTCTRCLGSMAPTGGDS